ncbi:MAG TPA: 30S ribosomal protein S12 methylthiotransferase RimO [Clostridiaceae bacterium]|nr:30S ribosomal protein S12 methylthiotransferase RimO [Clostridiaceae bacterium]
MKSELMNNFHILSLGCPKNEVDAESMSHALSNASFDFAADPGMANFLIVNTCGFIEPAKEEAISAILDLAEIKESNLNKNQPTFLIVTGCLGQRYATEIYREFPEVDLVLGTAQYDLIVDSVRRLKQGEILRGTLPGMPGSIKHLFKGEQAATDRSYAYLKIAEGCSNRCAFCAIPGIRGPLLSRPLEDVVAEAELLTERGFKEIILIAQDTTRYGQDIYGEPHLLELLKKLIKIPGIGLIRLMYVYGDVFSDQLIDFIAEHPQIASYIDLPIQHASDEILKSMGRRDTNKQLRELIAKMRLKIHNLIIRTTVLVGFPGETEQNFEELKQFIKDVRFDRLGCFVFSPEEGTRAYKMTDLPPREIAEARHDQIMSLQKTISLAKNQERIGQIYQVLLEDISSDGLFFVGRSYGEAPEIDPSIYVLAQTAEIKVGDIVNVKIIDADDYDLTGVSVHEFT